MSSTWALAINTLHPQLATTREQIMILLQKMIWMYILATWKVCNQHLHCNADHINLPNYHQAVITLYKQCHLLSPKAQEALYRQPIETVLELPTPHLQQWVLCGHQYFTQQLKAVEKQAVLHMQDICTYFWTNTQWNDNLHPP